MGRTRGGSGEPEYFSHSACSVRPAQSNRNIMRAEMRAAEHNFKLSRTHIKKVKIDRQNPF